MSCNLLKSTGLDQDQYELQYSLSPEPSQESNSLLLGLPSVTKENLDIIKIRITSCLVPQRDVFASLVLDQNGQYIRQLLALSQELELSGDIGSCAKIAEIIKGIVFLNSPAIVEFIIAVISSDLKYLSDS